AVAGGLEPGGDRAVVVEDLDAAVGRPVVVHAGVVCVLPGQDARAARAAERGGHVAVREGDARVLELAGHDRHDGTGPVRRLVDRVHRVPALVVGEDDHEVRPGGRPGVYGAGLRRLLNTGGRLQEKAVRERVGGSTYAVSPVGGGRLPGARIGERR